MIKYFRIRIGLSLLEIILITFEKYNSKYQYIYQHFNIYYISMHIIAPSLIRVIIYCMAINARRLECLNYPESANIKQYSNNDNARIMMPCSRISH